MNSLPEWMIVPIAIWGTMVLAFLYGIARTLDDDDIAAILRDRNSN